MLGDDFVDASVAVEVVAVYWMVFHAGTARAQLGKGEQSGFKKRNGFRLLFGVNYTHLKAA